MSDYVSFHAALPPCLTRTKTIMADTGLFFSAKKTSSNPKNRGCLIIGHVRNLKAVTFEDFAEKLAPTVDPEVG